MKFVPKGQCSGNGLAPNRQQVIIWNNNGLAYWRTSMWFNVFRTKIIILVCVLEFPMQITTISRQNNFNTPRMVGFITLGATGYWLVRW